MKSGLIGLVCLASVSQVMAGDGAERYVKSHKLPTGQVVVVAEGDLEPRSIGSYTVRVYSNSQPEYPTDDFLAGLVKERDGTVEDVLFADVNGDGIKDIVVTMRCVGTGSYLAAVAFTFKNKHLSEIGSVAGLPKDADCVAVLTKTIKEKSQKRK